MILGGNGTNPNLWVLVSALIEFEMARIIEEMPTNRYVMESATYFGRAVHCFTLVWQFELERRGINNRAKVKKWSQLDIVQKSIAYLTQIAQMDPMWKLEYNSEEVAIFKSELLGWRSPRDRHSVNVLDKAEIQCALEDYYFVPPPKAESNVKHLKPHSMPNMKWVGVLRTYNPLRN